MHKSQKENRSQVDLTMDRKVIEMVKADSSQHVNEKNGHQVHGEHGNGEGHNDGHGKHGEKEFNPFKMPCNWEMAKKHADAHRTGPDTKDDELNKKPETCPCCGFEIERQELGFWCKIEELSFLGAGFPLFYNYIRYCILILTIQICVKQIYNIITNFQGDYCSQLVYVELADQKQATESTCPDSIWLHLSLANKLNRPDQLQLMHILNLFSLTTIMITLFVFRRQQQSLDIIIDESQLTPSDYTICVKNIPTGVPVDYTHELTNIFQNYAVLDSEAHIVVSKVVLVYDIEAIVKMEEELEQLVDKKKNLLEFNDFNHHHPQIHEINHQIHHIHKQIEETEELYVATNQRFAGIAFVSFQTEDMKNLVLEHNTHTFKQRMLSFIHKGRTPDISEDELQWRNQKLFIEQAPEPNDVDWEFIHIPTREKIMCRIKSFVIYFFFEASVFLIIYIIQVQLSHMTDEAHQQELEGTIQPGTEIKIIVLCWVITLSIVLFNKFVVGVVIHLIVDLEKVSNKTKFQISFAQKLSVALFLNAAVISYIIDILMQGNIYGYGGFIYNETLIFILNALLPPLIWFIDPWTMIKDWQRKNEIAKGPHSLLTQQEANEMMEQVNYLSAKRYADIMKTMWFTFLFGSTIPIGFLCSYIGLIIYYFVDKHNLLRKRTVKECINKQLSMEMISLLELIIFFSPVGEISVSYAFFKSFPTYDLIILGVATCYALLPKDKILDTLFPLRNYEEPIVYEEGSLDFDSDYDRENPITKNKAIEEFNQMLEAKEQQGMHRHHLHIHTHVHSPKLYHHHHHRNKEKKEKTYNEKVQLMTPKQNKHTH